MKAMDDEALVDGMRKLAAEYSKLQGYDAASPVQRQISGRIGPLFAELAEERALPFRKRLLALGIHGDLPIRIIEYNVHAVLTKHNVPGAGLMRPTLTSLLCGRPIDACLEAIAQDWAWKQLSLPEVRLLLAPWESSDESGESRPRCVWECRINPVPAGLRQPERFADLGRQVAATFDLAWAESKRQSRELEVRLLVSDRVLTCFMFPDFTSGTADSRREPFGREGLQAALVAQEARLREQLVARGNRGLFVKTLAPYVLDLFKSRVVPSRGRTAAMKDAARWWALHQFERKSIRQIVEMEKEVSEAT